MLGPSATGLSGISGPGALGGLHRLHRVRRLHRLHRVRRLRRLERLDPLLAFAARAGRHRGWARRARTQPSVMWLLLAGVAVLAFTSVATAAGRGRRSTAERIFLVGLLMVLGLVVLSFRRSGARYR